MIKKTIFILIFSLFFTACVERGHNVNVHHYVHTNTNNGKILVKSDNSRSVDNQIPTLVVNNEKSIDTFSNNISGSIILIIGIILLF